MLKPSTVFKVLLGTMVLMVVITGFIEITNVQLTASMVTQLTTKSIRQAATLFGQETYKRADAQNINESSLVSFDNPAVAISGDFYGSGSPQDIYKSLYLNNSNYTVWLREHTGNWANLDNMYEAMTSRSLPGADKTLGKVYLENLMTPLNLGIAYLDRDTVERIARWNLSMILLNGVKDNATGRYINLKQDSRGIYVSYKGFKVYTGELRITNINYEVLDLTNGADVARFELLTHMDAATILAATDGDERRYFCIAGIEYTMPVYYEGITPIKTMAEFFWNYEVDGLENSARNSHTGREFNEAGDILEGGGTEGNGALPVPGKIIYYVTR